MCCVTSRSGSWSPSSVSPSAAAWCRSPPLAARPFRRSRRLSGSRVTAQKHREHKHQGNSECALYLQLTYWTMESPTITASHPISWRGAKRLREEISKTRGGEGEEVEGFGGRGHRQRPGLLLPLLHPGSVVSRRLSEGHLRRSRPGCTGPVQRNTRSWGVHTHPGLVGISSGCFQRCSPLPQLGLFPKQLVDLPLHGLQLHRMQLERVLTCTQR